MTRAPLSFEVCRRWRVTALRVISLDLDRSFPCGAWQRPQALRPRCVRSTSALRNLPNSSTHCVAVSQRCDPWSGLDTFRRLRPGNALVPSLAARARSRETSFFAPPLRSSEDARSGHRAARAARCERGRGESRFTTRLPLRRPIGQCVRALSPLARGHNDRL
jgi:hypothetical protein